MVTQRVGFAPDLVQEISEAAVDARHETAANAQLSGRRLRPIRPNRDPKLILSANRD
jgi:hypothetical protein